jgi:hypothetical protein
MRTPSNPTGERTNFLGRREMREREREESNGLNFFYRMLQYHVSLHDTVEFCKKKEEAIIHHQLGVFFGEYLQQYSLF